jgi:hypothetical protein
MIEDVQRVLVILAQSDEYRSRGIAATYRRIVNDLNNLSSPPKHWSWNYLHEVSRGRLQPSPILTAAILCLQNKLRIQHKQAPSFESTQVFAPAGYVAPGALILATSRKCAWELCRRDFVPLHPQQRFCNTSCRLQSHKARVKNKG